MSMGWRGSRQRNSGQQASAAPLAPFDPESRERLEWRQTERWKPRWELVSGERVFARLSRGGAFDNNMTLEFADAGWFVRHRWNGNLQAEPLSGVAKPAEHRSGFFTGKLVREGQPDLKSRSGGFWNPYWELVTIDEEQPLVRVRARSGFSRTEADIEITDAAHRRDDLELLLGLNWVIALVAMRQASHAAS
jgi:hypothetical protein